MPAANARRRSIACSVQRNSMISTRNSTTPCPRAHCRSPGEQTAGTPALERRRSSTRTYRKSLSVHQKIRGHLNPSLFDNNLHTRGLNIDRFKIGSQTVYFSYVESQKVTIESHYGEYLSQTPLEQHLGLQFWSVLQSVRDLNDPNSLAYFHVPRIIAPLNGPYRTLTQQLRPPSTTILSLDNNPLSRQQSSLSTTILSLDNNPLSRQQSSLSTTILSLDNNPLSRQQSSLSTTILSLDNNPLSRQQSSPSTTILSLDNNPLPFNSPLLFVIPSEAEGSAVRHSGAQHFNVLKPPSPCHPESL